MKNLLIGIAICFGIFLIAPFLYIVFSTCFEAWMAIMKDLGF
ncbi:MAG TPA: hypothetical protein VMW95_04390 [Desulfobacterales bacterium]|nr:hypothetical protein [Desulfobacterales bacterium]